MNFKTLFKKINPKNWPKFLRIIIPILFVILLSLLVKNIFFNSKTETSYSTTTVSKGILISSISATGTITSSNKTSITTGATGTIKNVYVKDGDFVKKGQKIADITLDDDGSYNQTLAWANYSTLLQDEKEAITSQTTADIKMWQDRQAVLDAQEEYNNMLAGAWNPATSAEYTYNEKAIVEKNLEKIKLQFTADETEYNNYTAIIAKARKQTAKAYENYKKVSSVIYAPADGIISNLSIAPGVIISNNSDSITVSTGTDSNTNSSSVTSHSIGSITNPQGQYQATLGLSESDIPKIKSGQKVTLTLDAFESLTFTGSVLAIDVSGNTNSGVTTYSVVVLLDDTDQEIYNNMAVSATIITQSKADVILIPSIAIDTDKSGNSTVRVSKDGQISAISIEIGDSNDSQTEIISGLTEGETIISSSISYDTKSNNNTSSEFSGGGFGGMGSGIPRL